MFYDDGNIDNDFAVKEMETFPDLLRGLSNEERNALSEAARRSLEFHRRPPDEYGYKPRTNEEELAFLDSLARGELYKSWLHPPLEK